MNDQNQLEVIETEPPPARTEPATVQQLTITPRQAKIEAVANLTMKAYERASLLNLTPEEAEKLEAEFPDEAFKLGAGGNPDLIYIEHAHLRDRLNKVFGPGQWAIVPRNRWSENFKTQKGDDATRVYVEAMLLVRGGFVAEAVGDMVYYPNNAVQNYGDAVEGAKSACLRRCAKELGIGLQAWKKDFCIGWKQRNTGNGATPRQKPTQATPAPSKPVQHPPSAASEPSGDWRSFRVPFGKNKDMQLGELNENQLRWYCENIEVKTEKEDGSPRPQAWIDKDQDFRDALDEAQETLSEEQTP